MIETIKEKLLRRDAFPEEESTEIPALSVRVGIDESFLFRSLTAFQNSF